MEASAKKESVQVVRMAAGAFPARTASSNTAVVVLEPTVFGIARMQPRAMRPESGWRAVNNLAGLVIVAAPETERLAADQQLALGFALDDHPALDHILP